MFLRTLRREASREVFSGVQASHWTCWIVGLKLESHSLLVS